MKSQTIPNVKSVEMKKTLFIKKVPISSNSTFKDDFKLLFENPSTYLRLPGESPKHYIVGKKPTGPRYDEDEKVIPHSIVGTPRMFKRKGQGNNKQRLIFMRFYAATHQSKRFGKGAGVHNIQRHNTDCHG